MSEFIMTRAGLTGGVGRPTKTFFTAIANTVQAGACINVGNTTPLKGSEASKLDLSTCAISCRQTNAPLVHFLLYTICHNRLNCMYCLYNKSIVQITVTFRLITRKALDQDAVIANALRDKIARHVLTTKSE